MLMSWSPIRTLNLDYTDFLSSFHFYCLENNQGITSNG